MIITLDEYLRSRPLSGAEADTSSEILVARSAVALAAARLEWSPALRRQIAYLPDNLLRHSLSTSLRAIHAHYGSGVLVVPDSVYFY